LLLLHVLLRQLALLTLLLLNLSFLALLHLPRNPRELQQSS